MTNPNPSNEAVSVDHLSIDQRVQRLEGVSKSRAQAIADNWQDEAAGAITVSRRTNGSMVILDGAHRAEAARVAGVSTLRALVYSGLTLQQEASIFNLLNSGKTPSYVSRFNARVVAGEPEATEIQAVVSGHGWQLSNVNATGHLAAVSSVERVYTSAAGALPAGRHPEVLDKTLGLITSAWGHDPDGANLNLIQGIGQVYGRLGESVDTEKLAGQLAKELPRPIIGRARALQSAQGGTVPAAVAKIIVGIHNSRRRVNLLPEWVWTR